MTIEVIEKKTWKTLEQYKMGCVPKANVERWFKKLHKISPERCMQLRRKAYSILF